MPRGGLLCAILLVGTGCTDLPIVSEGEHVVVRSEVAWCEETTGWIDESLVAIGAWLGVGVDELPPVTVRRYATAADGWSACGYPEINPLYSACATGHDVSLGNVDMILHELVHSVSLKVGDPPEWLFEGLADAIGAPPDSRGTVEPSAALLVLIMDDATFRSGIVHEHYAQAASFVRYLIDELGREVVLAMFAELPRGAGYDGVEAFFDRRGAESLDNLLYDWESRGPHAFSTVAQPVPGCEAPPIDGSPVRLRPGATTLLALTREARAVRRVSASGAAAIHIGAGDCFAGVRTTLLACGAPLPVYADTEVSSGASITLVYPVGELTHYVEVASRERGDPIACGTPCSAELRDEPLEVDACGSVRVPFTGEVVQIGGGGVSFVSLESAGGIDVAVTAASSPIPPEICELSDPCDPTPVECWPADATPHRVTTRSTVAHFRISQAGADGGPVFFAP